MDPLIQNFQHDLQLHVYKLKQVHSCLQYAMIRSFTVTSLKGNICLSMWVSMFSRALAVTFRDCPLILLVDFPARKKHHMYLVYHPS